MVESMIIPLAFLGEGMAGIVRSVSGGMGAKRRLYELGLMEGACIRVLKNDIGPILVDVKGSRFALGRGISMKILVEVVE